MVKSSKSGCYATLQRTTRDNALMQKQCNGRSSALLGAKILPLITAWKEPGK